MPLIFISYRRSDSQDVAGRIYDRLSSRFEKKQVFKDVDSIPLGVTFPMHLQQVLGKSAVVLVIIGPTWLAAADEQGRRRLDDPNDFVRVEVETALREHSRDSRPGFQRPHAAGSRVAKLDPGPYGGRNGIQVRPDPDFNNDIARLFSGIELLFEHLEKRRQKPKPVEAGPKTEREGQKKGARKPILGLLAGLVTILLAALIAFGVWRGYQGGGSGNKSTQKGKDNQKIDPTYENSIGMKFAWIAPGTFLMGSPKEEQDQVKVNGGDELLLKNEIQHKVTLTKGYYMGIHLVTQEQWQAVMGKNPSYFKGEKNLPVETISWDDCQEFIKKLREKDKKPYRLPTEAEWEYACRAGTTTLFYCGQTISTDQANYNGKETYGNGKLGIYREKTTPVGSFPANAWGLFDMHGNVWEWCQDWIGDFSQNDVLDPNGPNEGQYRVVRGGSWGGIPSYCRSAFRNHNSPDNRYYDYGFRVVLSYPEDSK